MDEEQGPGTSGESASRRAAAAREAVKRRGTSALAFVQAIGLGLKDTAEDVLRAGREGAAEAYDEMWARYERKTKHRRTREDED